MATYVQDTLPQFFDKEAAWLDYDRTARAVPDCDHNRAADRDRPEPPDCDHNRVWRAELRRAWLAYLAYLD